MRTENRHRRGLPPLRLGVGMKILFVLGVVSGVAILVAGMGIVGPSNVPVIGEERKTPKWEEADPGREDAGPYFEVSNDWEDPGPTDRYDRAEIERLVLKYTNEERTERGLNPVEMNPELRSVARNHSADMAQHGYLGHVDSEGRLPWERVDNSLCKAVGENADVTYYEVPISYYNNSETFVNEDEQDIAKTIIKDWMTSDIHRRTLLKEEYTSVGIGIYVSKANTVFATQVFCDDRQGSEA